MHHHPAGQDSPASSAPEWPAAGKTSRGLVPGPAGVLQTTVSMPRTAARGVALVCHPHPQHGGTQNNKVVTMLARAASEVSLAAVRFNFRGVGDSTGTYDAGRGEVEDARAVCHWMLQESNLPLMALTGFSFGSAVALRLAESELPPALVTVGFPAAYFDTAIPRPALRWQALFGDADDVIDVDAAMRSVQALEPPAEVTVMAGAGHFLHGRLTELRRHVRTFLEDATS